MSHFAKINNEGVVTELIVAEKNFINTGLVGDEFLWVQCSYNSNFRKNYPAIGDIYDSARNAFRKEQPFTSWTLNEDTCQWDSPVPYPTDDVDYTWDEETTNWKEVI
jgi:hypothetical protein